MKIGLLIILMLGFQLFCPAQSDESMRKVVTDMLEEFAEKQMVDGDYEELVEELVYLMQHPININAAEKEDLEQLFFLTDFQIENILYHIYTNGALYTKYELQAVEGMDLQTIQRLTPFIYVGEKPTRKRDLSVYGHLLCRYQVQFQKAKGYYSEDDTVSSEYIGTRDRVLMKARLFINKGIEAGYTLEKDPGEQYFPNSFPLTDFTSGFIQINQPFKYLHKVVIGDYKASFGQGVGMWSDMTFSKSSETAQLRRRPKGIKKYTSTNEASFLRGAGLEFRFDKFSISPFLSFKKRDAALEEDTTSGQTWVSSLKEDGYHRTDTELKNKNTINEQIYGGRMAYRHHLFHLDGGYVHWKLNKPLISKDHPKDLYRFDGDKQNTCWFGYSFFLNQLTLFGEIALQQNRYPGIYQGLTYQPGSDIIFSLAYRYYDVQYSAILSNPFSESSIVNGESGMYASIRFCPVRHLTVYAYGDVFKYNWMRYRLYAPSNGFECLIKTDYYINDQCWLYLRYKTTQKSINSEEMHSKTSSITEYQKDNVRFFYTYRALNALKLQSQVEHVTYVFNGKVKSTGWLFYQDLKCLSGTKVVLGLRYVYFDIEDYDSRIYMYEPDVLYAFSIPAYMDRGSRIIFNAKWTIMKDLKMWFRLGHTYYRDKKSIGSGWNEIKGNQKTEAKIQLLYRF